MPRRQWKLISRCDFLNALETFRTCRSDGVGAVRGTIDGFAALVCCTQERVADAKVDTRYAALRVDFNALPLSSAEVFEVPEARLFRGDKQNVVSVAGSKNTKTPRHRTFLKTADTGFPRLRDDLIQRRIARHRIRQLARFVGIRTSQFNRRRRAACFAVTEVQIQPVD